MARRVVKGVGGVVKEIMKTGGMTWEKVRKMGGVRGGVCPSTPSSASLLLQRPSLPGPRLPSTC